MLYALEETKVTVSREKRRNIIQPMPSRNYKKHKEDSAEGYPKYTDALLLMQPRRAKLEPTAPI
jgi:virulence-associated protein VagC